MADSGDIDNGFSPMLDSHDRNGEAMAQPNTYPFHTEMSHLYNEQYGNNMVTRVDNFHQNAHIPYSESAPNQSTTTDNNEWNQTVSNQCTTPNHDFYQSVPNTESTTSDYRFHQSNYPDHNCYQRVPDHNRYESVTDQSTTMHYCGHQPVKPHDVINIPPIQSDDCNKSEQMAHIALPSSMESSTSSVLEESKLGRRVRMKYTEKQKAILESAYERNSYPDSSTKCKIASYFGVMEYKIDNWFNYRRSRSRRNTEKNETETGTTQTSSHPIQMQQESSSTNNLRILEESKLRKIIKIKYTEEQKAILESYFQRNCYPDYRTKCQIASECGVNERQIHIWFNNRRAGSRRNTEKNETETGTTRTTSSHPIQMQQVSSSTQEIWFRNIRIKLQNDMKK